MSKETEIVEFCLASQARLASKLVEAGQEAVSTSKALNDLKDLLNAGGEPSPEKPAPPENFKAEVDSLGTVILTWTDPPENTDAYLLEGQPALAANASRYEISGLAPDTDFIIPRLCRMGQAENSDWVVASPASVHIPKGEIVIPDPKPDEYPGPPQGAKSVGANDDFTALAPGVYAVRGGTRTKDLLGLKPGVGLYCEKQYGVALKGIVRAFQTDRNTISGFDFLELGKAEKLNDNAGGLIGNKSLLSWCRFSLCKGVAAAFGRLEGDKVKSVEDSRAMFCSFLKNGSSGLGGKSNNSEVGYCFFDSNNQLVGDTDGCGGGKQTRSLYMWVHHNVIKNSSGTAWWFDIENAAWTFEYNLIDGVTKLKDNFRRRGITSEWSGEGQGKKITIRGNTFRNCAVPIVLEETGADGGVDVLDNVIHPVLDGTPEACEIHLRDYWKDRSNWSPSKRLRNVTIRGNSRIDGKPLRLARSNSGDKFSVADLTSRMGFIVDDAFVSIKAF